jgi:four helix bundle protein
MSDQESTSSFFRFEELRVYAKATDYAVWVHQIAAKMADLQQIQLSNRFLEAAQNIAINIAEGSARNKIQFVFYLKNAKESVRSCVVFTEIAFKLSLLDEDEVSFSRNQLMELTKMVGRLTTILKEASVNNHHQQQDEPEIQTLSED